MSSFQHHRAMTLLGVLGALLVFYLGAEAVLNMGRQTAEHHARHRERVIAYGILDDTFRWPIEMLRNRQNFYFNDNGLVQEQPAKYHLQVRTVTGDALDRFHLTLHFKDRTGESWQTEAVRRLWKVRP